jgi:hypothetical protein
VTMRVIIFADNASVSQALLRRFPSLQHGRHIRHFPKLGSDASGHRGRLPHYGRAQPQCPATARSF